MNDISSDESTDEEEINRNFETEAQLIVETDNLPKKSADRYMLIYHTYQRWKQEIVYYTTRAVPGAQFTAHVVYTIFLHIRSKVHVCFFCSLLIAAALPTEESPSFAFCPVSLCHMTTCFRCLRGQASKT